MSKRRGDDLGAGACGTYGGGDRSPLVPGVQSLARLSNGDLASREFFMRFQKSEVTAPDPKRAHRDTDARFPAQHG